MATIIDEYCEAFDGLFLRIIVTAKDRDTLEKTAICATALPSTVVGRSEAGIEKYLDESQSPDGRPGAIIQIWVNYSKNAISSLGYEASLRIRQGILVIPTTRIFNALESEDKLDIMPSVGYCGDGFEEEKQVIFGSKTYNMIDIPLMMPGFMIERHLGYKKGIMGGNIWYLCKDEKSALEAGKRAVEELKKMDNVICPFEICSAGSKVGSITAEKYKGSQKGEDYSKIGPTTNHLYCPQLKNKIENSLVPETVKSIPEIVINGATLDDIKKAMKKCIDCTVDIEGVESISCGNYGGNLGKYKIYLKDL